MMKRELLLLSAFAVSLSVMANENEADTSLFRHVDVDEVVVLGFKQGISERTPVSVTNLTDRYIHVNDMKSIKDLASVVPNFFIPAYGSRQNSPVFVRGVGSKTNGPTVGFYVDGVPHMERSSFDNDLFDISNIEVLRGPQGTLYGRNCIGGIINVYTRNPFAYQGTRVKLGYGNHNDAILQAYNYTKVSNSFGFAVSGGYHHNDGSFINTFDGNRIGKVDDGNIRGRMFWKPVSRLDVTLDLSYDNSDECGYPYALYDVDNKKAGEISYNRDSWYRRQIMTSGLNVKYDGQGFCVNSQTTYQYIYDRMAIDQDFTARDLYYVRQRVRQNIFSQEFTAKSTTDGRYQWLLGVFGFADFYDKSLRTDYISTSVEYPTVYDTPVRGASLYHQSSYRICAGLTAIAGLRFDYEHAHDHYFRYTTQIDASEWGSATSAYDSKLDFKQFTPKVTLEYQPDDSKMLYASLTRGYKTGGFNTTFQSDDERTYNPEYNWNYELGAKTSFMNNRLRTELTLFYVDWRHQQITQTLPGVGNITRNAGHSDSKGVELSVIANPFNPLTLTLTYGYTYARFLDYKKSSTVDYSGNVLPLVPRHTLALNGNYVITPCGGKIDKIIISAGLNGMGKIYWNEDNAVAQNFYVLLNSKISITSGRVTLDLWGKNLTDTEYLTYYFKSGSSYGQKGCPVSFGTSVIVDL